MEGALVRSLVAQVESEFPIVYDLASGVVEAGFFEPHGAMPEPVVLGHSLDSASSVGVVGWCSCWNSARSLLNSVCDSEGGTQNSLDVERP